MGTVSTSHYITITYCNVTSRDRHHSTDTPTVTHFAWFSRILALFPRKICNVTPNFRKFLRIFTVYYLYTSIYYRSHAIFVYHAFLARFSLFLAKLGWGLWQHARICVSMWYVFHVRTWYSYCISRIYIAYLQGVWSAVLGNSVVRALALKCKVLGFKSQH